MERTVAGRDIRPVHVAADPVVETVTSASTSK